MNSLERMVFESADRLCDQAVPHGVVSPDAVLVMAFTTSAFDFYIDRHGVPKDANAARRMFEFAAELDPCARVALGEP